MEGQHSLLHKELVNSIHVELEDLTEFRNLTKWQKRFIRLSLFLQERAMRKVGGDTDLVAFDVYNEWVGKYLNYVNSPKELNYRDIDTGKKVVLNLPNRQSQQFIADWNCHRSILALEKQSLEVEKYAPKEFFYSKDGYKRYGEYRDFLDSLISDEGPKVILFSSLSVENFERLNDMAIAHSCLYLGVNEREDQFVCWEKHGNNWPYLLRDLEDVYNEYSEYYIALRNLET